MAVTTDPRAGLTREFLPAGVTRPSRTREQLAAAGTSTFDYPATEVGVVGNVTVYYDPALGSQCLALAQQMLAAVTNPYTDMETYFGIPGGPVRVIIAPLSGSNDGSGGAYHYGCDFASGGDLYLDATFAATQNPLDLELSLYVAELSEAFMGAQNRGWGCGYSNGEGLSRFCAEQDTPPGSFPSWGITGPSWAQAGFPDWINKTEQTDQDYVSTGCAIVYLYWMRLLGFNNPQITLAGGATLAANYKTLTGKTTAYQDLMAALHNITVSSDNPFTPVPAGAWHANDVTAQSGAVATAGRPFGYVFNLNGTQHVVYHGLDNHIHELWWDGAWHTDDLNAQTGAVAAAGNPCAYMFVAGESQHVFYRGADNHIHELFWNGSWNTHDITAAVSGVAAAGDPAGYAFGANGTQHVFYVGSDGHVHELWWDGSWHTDDLMAQTGAVAAAGKPTAYMFDAQGTQHVVYRGTDHHIHELWWGGSWQTEDLTAITGASGPAGDPFGYMFDAERSQHVMYRGSDNHIHELLWNGSWHAGDLSAQTGAAAAAGDPAAYVFGAQLTQHVVYRGADQHIHELWWNGHWNAGDLSAQTFAPNALGDPVGYMFNAEGSQHVMYRGTDNHIHELWWG